MRGREDLLVSALGAGDACGGLPAKQCVDRISVVECPGGQEARRERIAGAIGVDSRRQAVMLEGRVAANAPAGAEDGLRARPCLR